MSQFPAYPTPDGVDEMELQTALANRLRAWKVSGNALERTFVLPDFKTALAFVNRIGEQAEAIQHHPDIDIRYNKILIHLTTHDAGGISRRDLMMAGYIDEFAPEYTEKRAA